MRKFNPSAIEFQRVNRGRLSFLNNPFFFPFLSILLPHVDRICLEMDLDDVSTTEEYKPKVREARGSSLTIVLPLVRNTCG